MGKLSNAKNLTKAEKYSIEGMHSNDMSIKEIAKALGREESLVSKYLDSFQEEKKETPESNGVTVMTEAISERLDRVRQNMPEKTPNSNIYYID